MSKPKKIEVAAPISEIPFYAQQIEIKAVDELRANPRNARIHPDDQLEALAASIRTYGFTIPILVTEDGMIIAGHGRVEAAATRLNLKEVPVIVAKGWSDEQIRLYTIADNRLGETSRWDETMLALELGDLESLGADLQMTGFDEEALGKFLAIKNEPDAPEEFDAYDEDIDVEHTCPKCGYQWSGGA
jgi:ParB-like chromosome segregation protein Spo0J